MKSFAFNRMELAGSLGDLGTLLPLGIGLIVLNGMNATSVMFAVGVFYIVSGTYFRIPVAVQPMKTIATYAIAMGLAPVEIASSGLIIGVVFIILGLTGAIDWIGKRIPHSVVRGIQLALGVVLLVKGLGLIVEIDDFGPYQSIGPLPAGVLLGIAGIATTIFLIPNKRVPAALVLVLGGILAGLILGKPLELSQLRPGLHLPVPLPYGLPSMETMLAVLPLLVLPQIPMTIGNAIISNTDLSRQYYEDRAFRMTHRAGTLSLGTANILSFLLGGMPMCHGAGGLSAHYRFGARTAGSNLIIGGFFVLLTLGFGDGLVGLLNLVPLAILGVLLAFSGLQLALMIQDLSDRNDFIVAVVILGVTMSFNLAWGFAAGIVAAYLLKVRKTAI